MALSILHTGQTGVERGADRAARSEAINIAGYSTFEQRDEIGALPAEIAAGLNNCMQKGTRSALKATLELSSALVVAVPDAKTANEVTGIEALRRAARLSDVPQWVVDPKTDLDLVIAQLHALHDPSRLLKVMVTGPRATRWVEGERFGGIIVARLSLALATGTKHRILVVDDHHDTVRTMCSLLRALGHECVAATSGAQGIARAATFRPDIVLLDIGLPDVSGYEVARQLRATQARPLFLAAISGREPNAGEAFSAGFDRHLIKPAGVEMISALIDQASTQLVS